ncbi:MAG: O-antigen ligase family protein [Bacteroidales bacterium]|nr:O-antigen ligase family protein [Bacteroidales bacterium]
MDANLAPRLLALGIVILLVTLLNIRKPLRDKPPINFIRLPVFPVFLLYFLWSIFSVTHAVNPAEGTFDITKTFLSAALLIFAVRIFIAYKQATSFLVKCVVLSALIATSIGLYQYFDKVPGHSGYDLLMALYEVKGLMAHKNQFAISLFLMLPFTFYGIMLLKKWWRGLSIYSTLLILLNIVILQTRSVWVATLVFLLSTLVLWLIVTFKNRASGYSGLRKKGLAIGMILMVVAAASFLVFQKSGTLSLVKYQVSSLFDSQSHNNQGRLKMWGSTWDLSQDNFLLGVGTGNWKIAIVPYYKVNYGSDYQNWRRPHNDFLWVLSEKGTIGLLLYLLIFIIIAVYGFKVLFSETDKNKLLLTLLTLSGIGGYLAIAFFTFPLERINHQVYLMIMMAAILSAYYARQKKPGQIKNKTYTQILLLMILPAVFSIYYAGILIRAEVNVRKLNREMNTRNQKKIIAYADKAFTKFTTIDYNALPIPIYKGIANMRMQNYRQAYADLQLALKYFPTQIAVLSNLAIVSAELNNSKQALVYLNRSLELFPHYEPSLYNKINVYYKEKEYTNAYITLLNCNTKKPDEDYEKYMKFLKSRVDTQEQ